MKRLMVLTFLYGGGTALLWGYGSWKIALGVWVMLWAVRYEASMGRATESERLQSSLDRLMEMKRTRQLK